MSINQQNTHPFQWLATAKRLQAIAQAGLSFSDNGYDIERYEEIREISVKMMSHYTGEDFTKVKSLFAAGKGYQTPMVDIRAVIFKDGKILLVKEKVDGRWSLPGGWADVGYSPAEVAAKETREEAGFEVKAKRLLAVFDKKFHPHPPEPHYVYKIFLLCEYVGGKAMAGTETSDVGFFNRRELPPLSEERNTSVQIEMMFAYQDDPGKEVYFE